MDITFLLKLISQLGTKLPQAWPYIIHIASDIAAIMAILKDVTPPALATGEESTEVASARSQLLGLGLPAEEVDEVVAAFASAKIE